MNEEVKRKLLIEDRDRAIQLALEAMERGKIKRASKFYEVAADACMALGIPEKANELRNHSVEILNNQKELKKLAKEKKN